MKLKLQEKQQEMKEYRTKMEEKFMQQDKVIAHKTRQANDLKETIALKITVAEDLQNLMKQQRQELTESKQQQKEEYRVAKEEVEETRAEMLRHRDEMLQKLWTSQNEV